MKKRMVALMSAMLLLCALPMATVHAEPDLEPLVTETVVEEYLYTDSVMSTLSFSGSTANCYSSVYGNSKCTKIEGTQRLQKKTLWWWTDVKAWSKTVEGKSLIMSNTATVTESGTYRVRIDAKVYSGNDYEEVYCNSPEREKS